MKEIILIKYGELTTKKANRNLFIKTLEQNIKNSLIITEAFNLPKLLNLIKQSVQ